MGLESWPRLPSRHIPWQDASAESLHPRPSGPTGCHACLQWGGAGLRGTDSSGKGQRARTRRLALASSGAGQFSPGLSPFHNDCHLQGSDICTWGRNRIRSAVTNDLTRWPGPGTPPLRDGLRVQAGLQAPQYRFLQPREPAALPRPLVLDLTARGLVPASSRQRYPPPPPLPRTPAPLLISRSMFQDRVSPKVQRGGKARPPDSGATPAVKPGAETCSQEAPQPRPSFRPRKVFLLPAEASQTQKPCP